MLEAYDHAVARGAKIYAEVLGYGLSGDAYHITAPSEDGDGGYRSMEMALKRAGLRPADVDYINAHGTSTMADTIELGAVERLLGDAASGVTMSSTKSSIGHLLGAAGCGGGDLLHPRDPRSGGPPDDQPRQPRVWRRCSTSRRTRP